MEKKRIVHRDDFYTLTQMFCEKSYDLTDECHIPFEIFAQLAEAIHTTYEDVENLNVVSELNYYDDNTSVYVEFTRLETDEEFERRERQAEASRKSAAKRKEREAAKAAKKEAEERALYEKLRDKYEKEKTL